MTGIIQMDRGTRPFEVRPTLAAPVGAASSVARPCDEVTMANEDEPSVAGALEIDRLLGDLRRAREEGARVAEAKRAAAAEARLKAERALAESPIRQLLREQGPRVDAALADWRAARAPALRSLRLPFQLCFVPSNPGDSSSAMRLAYYGCSGPAWLARVSATPLELYSRLSGYMTVIPWRLSVPSLASLAGPVTGDFYCRLESLQLGASIVRVVDSGELDTELAKWLDEEIEIARPWRSPG